MKEIEIKGLNEVVYYEKLNNGLDVYMWVNPKVNTYYATLSVKYGSMHNDYKIEDKEYNTSNGIAHFLEHVKFNINNKETAHDKFSKLGSNTNAFTTFKYTCYEVSGSENINENINVLLDFVQNRYFTKRLISKEKGIIVEEAKMGEDDPYNRMYFKTFDNLFHKYKCKNEITGSVKDIKGINMEEIVNTFDAFYHPKNMFLVVTGNFNPYELMESIKENQNNKDFKEYLNPKVIIPKEDKSVAKEYDEEELNIQNNRISISIKIPKSNFKDMDEIDTRIYLNTIIRSNFGNTSDFKNELLQKEIVTYASNNVTNFDDYYVIMFFITSNNTSEVIDRYNKKLNDLKIEEKVFNRMKKVNIATSVTDYENINVVNYIIQNDILNSGNVIDNFKERLERLSYKKINDIINNLDLSNKSIIVFKKKNI